jgi:hypothetical protein
MSGTFQNILESIFKYLFGYVLMHSAALLGHYGKIITPAKVIQLDLA